MAPAAHVSRLLAILGVAVLAHAGMEAAGEPAVRSAPLRPGATSPALSSATASKLKGRKLETLEYVNLAEVAAELGLKFRWVERRHKAVLTGPSIQAEIEADTRDVTINGLRVFLGDPALDADGRLYVSRVDYERCLTPRLRPGHGVAPRSSPKVIVLDPGHGGRDNGTSVNEKIYVLDVARRAQKILVAAGYQVILTRDEDRFLELKERALIANTANADLFLSIHFNALPKDSKTSGIEVFSFAPRYQRSANAWSPRMKDDTEDFASPVNQFDHWSSALAQAVHGRLIRELKAIDRGAKLAHWGVLRPLQCPGILVECGFLTSEAEARKIATPSYRQELAEGLAAGVRQYAGLLKGP